MSETLQALRGMRDILPPESFYWRFLDRQLSTLAESAGYQEIRLPLLEKTALFKRTIGEATDIVEKEMYTFEDRNGDSVSLRPEGTASCVRAGLENGLLYNQTQRWWYSGPMFRHERPQKGRYRQFHQFGLEAFGMTGPELDAEVILLTQRLWRELGIAGTLRLQLNSLGTLSARTAYKNKLVAYLQTHYERLDADSQRRLQTNPLRILDSKVESMRSIVADAPKLADDLEEASTAHFQRLCELLTAAGVTYELNPTLVRGLDYYNDTVFEWVTEALGSQGTVCAGGRYDSLVEQLGGKPTPAFGCALGIERVVELLQAQTQLQFHPHVYLILVGEKALATGLILAENLRQSVSGLRLQMNCGGGNFKAQFKRADKSGALLALIIGDDEIRDGIAGVKFLRAERPQQNIPQAQLAKFLAEEIRELK